MNAAAPQAPLLQRWAALLAAEPRRPLLHGGGLVLTRADFEAQIHAEQQRLANEGVAPGEVVAWLGINTPQMLALLFACARQQAVFLPLNWRLAIEELQAVCRHAGVRLLLASADQRATAAQLRADGALPPQVMAPPGPGASPSSGDLLLVYTSGTTGRPKGALHTQAAMMANAEAAIAVQGLDAGTRTLSALPMFHVGGLCIQTLPTLLAGGEIGLMPRFEPAAWLREVAAWRPHTSLMVPATMRAVIEHPAFAGSDLSSLRFLNSGSSVVPVALIEAFHARGVPVAQVYGATETGPVSIALAPHEALAQVGRVGCAAPGVEVRLVDEQGRAVARGAVGEIRLRGANLMRGYHREPRSAAFDAEGWFATGDLAREHEDGRFEVVGRSKEMIISGGENIYPAEIENLIAGHPQIGEAAVVGVADDRWGEVPVLVVEPRGEVPVDTEALAAFFEGRLARYKHPRRIVVRQALPRTALGKVRKADLAAELVAELAAGRNDAALRPRQADPPAGA